MAPAGPSPRPWPLWRGLPKATACGRGRLLALLVTLPSLGEDGRRIANPFEKRQATHSSPPPCVVELKEQVRTPGHPSPTTAIVSTAIPVLGANSHDADVARSGFELTRSQRRSSEKRATPFGRLRLPYFYSSCHRIPAILYRILYHRLLQVAVCWADCRNGLSALVFLGSTWRVRTGTLSAGWENHLCEMASDLCACALAA